MRLINIDSFQCYDNKMGRTKYFLTLIIAFVVLAVHSTQCLRTHTAGRKKNVMVIIGDDAGFQMGIYNNTACKTPNFDRLAERSVIFDHAYTSVSSCSPSRSTLMTGLPQHQNGMYGLHHLPHHFISFENVTSLPVILGGHGIRTGIVGKKHVGPDDVYKFDYEETEENNVLNQVGRNITYMMEKMRPFLESTDDRPFFLYVGFFDPHRDHFKGSFGPFMEKFGNGEPGMGVIPDWKPTHYDPDDVIVPYFIPDTPAARADIAAQYTTISRIDQGIGLIMSELERLKLLDDTLIIFTADNGIPWPNAKTNLYSPGMSEPMFVSSPLHPDNWGKRTQSHASLLDVVPTVLDWFGVDYPSNRIKPHLAKTQLTGQSLLPVTAAPEVLISDTAFGSHDLHEVTMYYPMRVIKSGTYRLLHNLNFKSPFVHSTDLFGCPTWMDVMNRTAHGQPINWFKTLDQYYYRDQWELFDTENDPMELKNLAADPTMSNVLESLKQRLMDWQKATDDPWRCFPAGVLEQDGKCYSAHNGITL